MIDVSSSGRDFNCLLLNVHLIYTHIHVYIYIYTYTYAYKLCNGSIHLFNLLYVLAEKKEKKRKQQGNTFSGSYTKAIHM